MRELPYTSAIRRPSRASCKGKRSFRSSPTAVGLLLDKTANAWAPLLVDEYGQDRITMSRLVLLSTRHLRSVKQGETSYFQKH